MKSRVKDLGSLKASGFTDTLRAAIRVEFPTQEAFARALGVTPGQISHYLDEKQPVKPETLLAILDGFSSPALQEFVHNAWVREFAPLPDLPPATSEAEVIRTSEQVVGQGLTRRAIAFAERALETLTEPRDWHRVAERLVPWRLRVGDVSRAWHLSNTVEDRARARGDTIGVLSALAMKGTVLRQIDSVTSKAIVNAHETVVREMELFRPKNPDERRQLEYRRASVLREYSVQVLFLVQQRRIAPSHLEDARRCIVASLSLDESDIIQAAGLEVKSRIEVALGHLINAEDTLDELEAVGLDKAFELWEKTSCTRALIQRARGERDEAVATLQALRDRCEANQDWHHFRRADQLLVHTLAGI